MGIDKEWCDKLLEIPKDYTHLVAPVLEWHLKRFIACDYDGKETEERLNRILERWYKNHRQILSGEKVFGIEHKELWFLANAVFDAKNAPEDFPETKSLIEDFYWWLNSQYIKSKRS